MLQIAVSARTYRLLCLRELLRWKISGEVDFSSRLEMICNETDGARKFWRWRCYRTTWPDLEGPSRLEST